MMNRRDFIGTTAGTIAGSLAQNGSLTQSKQPSRRPVLSIHVWVYSSDKPNYDCFPILDQVFADVKYAGFDAFELMHLRDHLWTGIWSEASGEGIMDWPAIGRQLQQIRFSGSRQFENEP